MTIQELSPDEFAEIKRLEEAMWRAETRFDLVFQETRFAPDFLEFGRSGRVYQRENIIREGGHRIDATIPLPDFAVRVLDENTVLVTYNSAATYEGVTEHARRSSIWSRSAAGWVTRFHQGTPYTP